MLLKRSFWVSVFLCMAMIMLAGDYNVTGRIVNADGETEPYVTIRIYSAADSTRAVAVGTSGESGSFSFGLPAEGSYRLLTTAVGKKPNTVEFAVADAAPSAAMGDILLADLPAELAEVTVTAQLPLVTKEIDRIAYDVQSDDESKTSSVQEILRKVPMVSVDADGTIKINGSGNFKIYKNGRPNSSFSNNAKDIFKAIPASTIKKIEVITDPGAREDAEGVGAILNIVTVQNSTIKGIMGSIGANGGNVQPVPSPYLWLTGQIDKVTLSANGGYFSARGPIFKSKSSSEYIYESNGNRMTSTGESVWRRGHNDGYFLGLEGSYELDSLNLLTAEFSGFSYKSHTPMRTSTAMTDAAGNLLYGYDSYSPLSNTTYMDFNGAFNYQRLTRRKGEMITLSYMISTNGNDTKSLTEYDNLVNPPFDYTSIDEWSHGRFIEHTGQLDWTHPINDRHKFDIGGKFIFRDNHATGDRQYTGSSLLPDVATDYTHRTSIGAAYFDWRSTFGKITLRGGLRYEFSRLTSRDKKESGNDFRTDLNDYVPMAAVNYNINPSHTLKLAYNTRISRPGIDQLNPTVITTPNTVTYGNPNLSSALFHTIGLNYNVIKPRFNADFSLSYRFSNNGVNSVKWTETVDGTEVTFNTQRNIGRNRVLSLNGYYRWMITAKTTWMTNFGASRATLRYPSEDISTSGWSVNFYSNISQKLPWRLTANLRVFGWYSNFGLYSRQQFSPSDLYYGISFNRNFLKEDRLSVNVNISNPFGPYKAKTKTIFMNGGYHGSSYSHSYNRCMVNVSVSWRFGSLNAYVKKAERAASNDDLESTRPSTTPAGN